MLTEIKTNTQHYYLDEQNRRQGEFKRYHDNGQLYLHAFYQHGKRHGEYKGYFDNGKLWTHAFYQNGNLHGEYKDYHENGQLWEHSFFQNNILHGEYKVYHENGKLYHATFHYQGKDLNVNPDSLSAKDKAYIALSGRLPPKEQND